MNYVIYPFSVNHQLVLIEVKGGDEANPSGHKETGRNTQLRAHIILSHTCN